jgi:uncharacterized protein
MSEKELIEKDLDELAQKQQEEQLRNLERYHFLKDNGYILFETITGSQAHGTNTETSDIDKAFVYILPENDILGTEYKEQLKIHKDFMGYEIRRFLELLKKGNPTILELLNSPEDCLLIKHPAFDILLNQKEKFITKACENAFHGYAKQQRIKAEGLEKLQNWEVNRVTKKNPLDFCYVAQGYDAVPVKNWLDARGLDQLFCALTAVNHCRDLFAVFYDYEAHAAFSERIPIEDREEYKARKKAAGETMGLGYKGIAFEDSNDIRLSHIPFEERTKSICNLSYNKDGYRKHCDDFKKYQNWLENRNENRWVEIQGHGQQIDGKNMMHFMRLVLIGREIAQGKGIQIRRPDAQELLKIRRGEVSLQELFDKSDEILNEMKALFQNSDLPEEVSQEFIHNLIVQIRKSFYKQYNTYGRFAAANLEETNPFIVKTYGGKSELYDFIVKTLVDKVMDSFGGDFESFNEDIEVSNVMDCFIYNSRFWPNTRNTNQPEKVEKVSTENFIVVGMSRDKISVMAGGDWQEPIEFDIVIWQDTLVAINVKFAAKWNSEIAVDKEHFFNKLGYTLTDKDEDNNK